MSGIDTALEFFLLLLFVFKMLDYSFSVYGCHVGKCLCSNCEGSRVFLHGVKQGSDTSACAAVLPSTRSSMDRVVSLRSKSKF